MGGIIFIYLAVLMLVFILACDAFVVERGRPRRIAALMVLTMWAWPVWLIGWAIYSLIQVCLVAAGRRP